MSRQQLAEHVAPPRPVDWVDIGRIVALTTLISALVSVGAAWGTQGSALAQKVDRIDFATHVAQADRRFQLDSIERAYLAATLRRMEAKQDSTNRRLSRLICERGPSYCE